MNENDIGAARLGFPLPLSSNPSRSLRARGVQEKERPAEAGLSNSLSRGSCRFDRHHRIGRVGDSEGLLGVRREGERGVEEFSGGMATAIHNKVLQLNQNQIERPRRSGWHREVVNGEPRLLVRFVIPRHGNQDTSSPFEQPRLDSSGPGGRRTDGTPVQVNNFDSNWNRRRDQPLGIASTPTTPPNASLIIAGRKRGLFQDNSQSWADSPSTIHEDQDEHNPFSRAEYHLQNMERHIKRTRHDEGKKVTLINPPVQQLHPDEDDVFRDRIFRDPGQQRKIATLMNANLSPKHQFMRYIEDQNAKPSEWGRIRPESPPLEEDPLGMNNLDAGILISKGSPVPRGRMPSMGVFQSPHTTVPGMDPFGPAVNSGMMGKEQAAYDPKGKGVDRSNQFGTLRTHQRMGPRRPAKPSVGSCSGVNPVASTSGTNNDTTNNAINNQGPMLIHSTHFRLEQDASIIDEKTRSVPQFHQHAPYGIAITDLPGPFDSPDGELGHEHFLSDVAGPGPEIVDDGKIIFDSYLDTNDSMFDDMRDDDGGGELLLFPGAPRGNYCPGPDAMEI